MKMRLCWLPLALALLVPGGGSLAAPQNVGNGGAALAREQLEENLRAVTADLEDLKKSFLLNERRIAALEIENRSLREEIRNAAGKSASPESVKRLAEQLQEVDKRRIEDNKRVLEKLQEIAREMSKPPVLPPPPRGRSSAATETELVPAGTPPNRGSNGTAGGRRPPVAPPAVPGNNTNVPVITEHGYEYEVQKNDRLDKIAKYYQDQGVKVTSKAIMDANPGVKWDRLQVKQKIFVPLPKAP